MVAHRERRRLVEVGIRHPRDGARPEKIVAAKDDIRADRLGRHLGYLVVSDHLELASAAHADVRDSLELAAEFLERRFRGRRIRSLRLRRVVECRQVQVRLVDVVRVRHLLEPRDAHAPDLRRGERPPIAPERKPAAQLLEYRRHAGRLGVAAHDHSAAVLVDRRRGDDYIGLLAERLLEEEKPDRTALRTSLRPHATPLHDARTLLPEEGLAQILRPPAVRDYAVFGWREAGPERRLRDARHGGEHARRGAEPEPRHFEHSATLEEIVAKPGRHYSQSLHPRSQLYQNPALLLNTAGSHPSRFRIWR